MAIDKELFYASHGLKYPVVARPYTDDMEVKEVVFTKADMVDVLNRIRAEIEDTLYVDSLIFGELIDFKNGKISADDIIEEFNRVTRLEVLKIIDKYKAESEDNK